MASPQDAGIFGPSSRRTFLKVTGATIAAAATGGASSTPGVAQVTAVLDTILKEITIRGFHRALAAGEVTSLQATRWYLERIEKHDQQGVTLNAIVTINPAAEDEARRRDQEFSQGKARGLLHGVPVVIKDNIDVAGLPTTGDAGRFGNWCPARMPSSCSICAMPAP